MNICSVVVNTKPELSQKIKGIIEQNAGAEVHGGLVEGKLIVTVEQDDDSAMADTITGFANIEGVLSTSMIYHHYEEIETERGAAV